MPELSFRVEGAEALELAAVPTVVFKLGIEERSGVSVRSLSLTTQVRITANQRPYSVEEQQRLVGVFGQPSGWLTALNSLLWTETTSVVPPFVGGAVVELKVPCTYDFEVVSARYFHALQDGVAPLEFLFSGSVFYAGQTGLQVERISWQNEAYFSLPVGVWKQAVQYAFPNSAWLRLPRDSFDRLASFRGRYALPTWEAAIDMLLAHAAREELVSS